MDRGVIVTGERGAKPSFAGQFREFVRRNLTWFLVAGFVLLLIQDVFGTHGVLAMRRSLVQASAMQKRIDDLNNENRKLQDSVKSLKSNPAAIERIAREEMGLARPGEFVFKTQPNSGSKQSPQPAAPAPTRSSQ